MTAMIYILESDEQLRQLLCDIFASAGYETREFGEGEAFLDAVESLGGSPRCLVLAELLSTMSGLDVQGELRRRNITVPIVMLSGEAEVSTAVEALQNGATDFLEKPVEPEALLKSVARALEFDRSRSEHRSHEVDFQIRCRSLSSREREVLDLTVLGRNSKEISATLGIGVSTVLKHKSHMLAKMGVKNDVELTLFAASVEHPANPLLTEHPE